MMILINTRLLEEPRGRGRTMFRNFLRLFVLKAQTVFVFKVFSMTELEKLISILKRGFYETNNFSFYVNFGFHIS